MFVTPIYDPGFARHNIHGAVAQYDFIRRCVRFCGTQRRVAVDVGAHIGLCTHALLALGFGMVHAFEPEPGNFDCLQDNIDSERVRLHNVALGAESGTCDLTLPANENSGCFFAVPGASREVHALDEYGLRNVDFVKIDTEGFEGLVVQGASNTLRRCRPVVVFEDNGLGAKHYGSDWVDPKTELTKLGYHQAVRIRKDEVWLPN